LIGIFIRSGLENRTGSLRHGGKALGEIEPRIPLNRKEPKMFREHGKKHDGEEYVKITATVSNVVETGSWICRCTVVEPDPNEPKFIRVSARIPTESELDQMWGRRRRKRPSGG
jgi:hypothetical protein